MNASARSVPPAPPALPPASASAHTVLSYAVEVAKRAPSAHNTQPWAPRVLEHSIELGVTPARTLPAADPTSRDLLLALGAWVECVSIAANACGHHIVVERLPDLDRLEELPVTGEADVARPVLRISLASPDRALPELLPDRPLPDGAANVPFSRFTPRTPDYTRDGLSDQVLLLPLPVARLAAAAMSRGWLVRKVALVAGSLGRSSVGLLRERPLPSPRKIKGGGRHFALVADAKQAGATSVLSLTEALGSSIGIEQELVLEAGRVLQRLWLDAHLSGAVVAPHSEVIDGPDAHAALRRRLRLSRAEVALAVFSCGRAGVPVPRSPRLP